MSLLLTNRSLQESPIPLAPSPALSVSATGEIHKIPRNFRQRSRIEQNLIAFVIAATDPLTREARSVLLQPLVVEAEEVLQCLQAMSSPPPTPQSSAECGGSDSFNNTTSSSSSPSKPSVGFASLNKRDRLLPNASTNSAVLSSSAVSTSDIALGLSNRQGKGSSMRDTSSVLSCASEQVRYFVAACRASPPSKALMLLEQASASGSLLASVELGLCFVFGVGCTPSIGMGLELLDGGVTVGHPGAMLAVAKCLREGLGVPFDVRTSLLWLTRAAEQDYVFAQHELGELYEDGFEGVRGGLSIEKSLPHALRWYKRAALKGLDSSMLNLGKMMFVGSQVDVGNVATIDPQAVPAWGELSMKAKYWLEQAAERGNVEAKQLVDRMANASGNV